MEYWKECVMEAFEDANIIATEDQLDTVVSWVEGAHDNYSMATGLDVANANYISEEAIELQRMKEEKESNERWLNESKPCRSCNTTGVVRDGWGRDSTCYECNGKGRNRIVFTGLSSASNKEIKA